MQPNGVKTPGAEKDRFGEFRGAETHVTETRLDRHTGFDRPRRDSIGAGRLIVD